jgi:hypothetical protein
MSILIIKLLNVKGGTKERPQECPNRTGEIFQRQRLVMKTLSAFGCAKRNYEENTYLLSGVHQIGALIRYNLLIPYLNLV